MSIYSSFVSFISAQRARRLQLRTARGIADLPFGIQKDIGFPDGIDFDRDFCARCHSATETP